MHLRAHFLRAGFLVAALLAFTAPSANAQTCVCTGTQIAGGLVAGVTWTPAGSPYCINGNIQVSLLTIQAGVEVRCAPDVMIDVLSTISAQGTAAAPIRFTSQCANPTSAQRWSCIRFQNALPGSILEWCVIENARNSGLRIQDSAPDVRRCTFVDNTSDGSNGFPPTGGGIDVLNTSASSALILRFEDCTIRDNSAASHGGGINAILNVGELQLVRTKIYRNTANPSNAYSVSYVGGGVRVEGNAVLTNCWVSDNRVNSLAGTFQTVNAHGGGIYYNKLSDAASSLTIESCVVRDNTVYACACGAFTAGYGYGGGVYCYDGVATITNSIVAGNQHVTSSGGDGAGLYVRAGTAALENCTIARNSNGYYGLSAAAGSTVTATNCILFYNNYDPGTTTYGLQIGGTPTVFYSDVQNGYTGTGNINLNPVFAGTGTESCDSRISIGSPCIDAGDPSSVFNDARQYFPGLPYGLRNDMGSHGGPGNDAWVTNAIGGWVNYCAATANSTGVAAHIDAGGSTSVATNNLTLIASSLPPNTPGLFFYGCTAIQSTFGNGYRCITGSVIRLSPNYANASGVATRPLDLLTLPALGLIGAGDVRRFQYWYRNPAGGGAGFNLTEGLEVFFQP